MRFCIPFLSCLLALCIVAIPIVSDSSDDASDFPLLSSGDYTYTHPDTINAKTGDDRITVTIKDGMITEYAQYVVQRGNGTVSTNFPSWITYGMSHSSGGYLEIYIDPSAERNTVYWLEMSPKNASFKVVVNIAVNISGSPDVGGGDNPVVGGNDYVYTYPDEISLNTNSPTLTLTIKDGMITEYAQYVVQRGNGTVSTNFPSWITYGMSHSSGGYLEINISPGAAVDKQYYLAMHPDNTSFTIYVKFNLNVAYVDPDDGGDRPINPDPDNEEDKKIYVPLYTVWDYFAELLSNTLVVLLALLSMIAGALLVRNDTKRRYY